MTNLTKKQEILLRKLRKSLKSSKTDETANLKELVAILLGVPRSISKSKITFCEGALLKYITLPFPTHQKTVGGLRTRRIISISLLIDSLREEIISEDPKKYWLRAGN